MVIYHAQKRDAIGWALFAARGCLRGFVWAVGFLQGTVGPMPCRSPPICIALTSLKIMWEIIAGSRSTQYIHD